NRIEVVEDHAELRLFFNRTETGTIYTLQARHGEKEFNLQYSGFILLSLEPCYFIVKNRLYSLHQKISGKLLKPFRSKTSVIIPRRAENEYFNRFIKKVANKVEIEAEGFEIQDLDLQPETILTLETDWQGFTGFSLAFDYGERQVMANNPQQTFTNLEINEGIIRFKRFSRKTDWENTQKDKLKALGMMEHGAFYRFDGQDIKSELHGFVSYVSECVDDLRTSGFSIKQNTEMQYILEKPLIQTKYKFNHDWFDLHIEVRLGDYLVPFIHLKNNILTNNRLYLLPSGECFVLPTEWFERYKLVMIHGVEKANSIRLGKHHFRLLDPFEIDEAEGFAEKPEEKEIDSRFIISNTTLRPYQHYGFLWMRRNVNQGFGSILADDMGLGKTIQVIALLSAYFRELPAQKSKEAQKAAENIQKASPQLDLFGDLKKNSENYGFSNRENTNAPALVVAPTSIVHNWKNELGRFAPHLSAYLYTGANRELTPLVLSRAHLIITTYGILRNDIKLLTNYHFSFIILDESQFIKNHESKTAQAVFQLQGLRRVALTGTPVENRLSDLWSQLHFTNPGMLGGCDEFMNHYAAPLLKNANAPEGRKLLHMIEPFILRRTKSQVEPELPELTQTTIYCEMTGRQQLLYETERSRQRNHLLESSEGVKHNKKSLFMMLRALMRLRQYANHPRMVSADYDEESGKFESVTEMLETLHAENHKVLVFSSFVSHLNLYEQYCRQRGIEYAKLVGETRKREEETEKFSKRDDVTIFLISLKAGGLGLNLTEAAYVLLLDPWWNPASEMQAISRAHRIGQKKKVMVYRFITRGTVEEKILKLQEQKLALANTFIREDKMLAGLSDEQLQDLLK
ncbi:MAG TPA: DEAD/DEAH box helicase, partial [Bacteroidales bacterium]|nr:DEAD/DEAH box helicase [Bacteroidales bacterium]